MSSIGMSEQHDHRNEEPAGRGRPVILLAEDNDDTRSVYGLILRHYGYDVREALDGRDALERARALRPSLILMDIGLPEIDGWQVSRILKGDQPTRHIPVIAFSANIDSTSDLAEHRAFDGFIAKPVSPIDLVRRIQSYCELLDIAPRRTG